MRQQQEEFPGHNECKHFVEDTFCNSTTSCSERALTQHIRPLLDHLRVVKTGCVAAATLKTLLDDLPASDAGNPGLKYVEKPFFIPLIATGRLRLGVLLQVMISLVPAPEIGSTVNPFDIGDARRRDHPRSRDRDSDRDRGRDRCRDNDDMAQSSPSCVLIMRNIPPGATEGTVTAVRLAAMRWRLKAVPYLTTSLNLTDVGCCGSTTSKPVGAGADAADRCVERVSICLCFPLPLA